MKWYTDKYYDLQNAKPIISLCGDDCAVCPRFLAKTDDELHQTAVFWEKAGWRDRVVSNEEISCTGCASKGVCAFGLLECVKSHGVSRCQQCREFVCEKIKKAMENSDAKKATCKNACESEKEFELFCRSFYEKEKNLNIHNQHNKTRDRK